MSVLDPKRTIAELKELRALTGNENGAQRVAFTPAWVAARDWLRFDASSLAFTGEGAASSLAWDCTRAAKALACSTINALFKTNNCCCGTVVCVRFSQVRLASGKSNMRSVPFRSSRLTLP